MGNTNASHTDIIKIDTKLNELFLVILDYLIIKKELTNEILTKNFMKGYKSEKCTLDEEECKKGISFKKEARDLIINKTGKKVCSHIIQLIQDFIHDLHSADSETKNLYIYLFCSERRKESRNS